MAYKDYDDKKILDGVKQVKSISGLLRFLGKKDVGGNFYTMKKKLKELNADCSHWTGQAWNKGEQLKNWEDYSETRNFRNHLIKLKNYTCEVCKNTEWCGKPIPLEVHHIDGDRTNNEISNLQCLCANCHSQTPNFRARNK